VRSTPPALPAAASAIDPVSTSNAPDSRNRSDIPEVTSAGFTCEGNALPDG
jgi:hypothetical protein